MRLQPIRLFRVLGALLVLALWGSATQAGEKAADPAKKMLDEVAPPKTTPPAKTSKEKPVKPKVRGITPKEAARLRTRLRAVTDRMYRDAKAFYWQDNWDLCIDKCGQILKRDPGNFKAQKLKYEAEKTKIEHRLKMLDQERKMKDKEAIADVDDASNFPDRKPPLPRPVKKRLIAPLPLRVAKPAKSEKMLAMEQKLNQRVDLNLMDVDLDFLLSTLQRISGVNVIADQNALTDKKLTVLVENMPLKEILKFIVRNVDDIAYTVTEEAIWVTQKGEAHPGMEVRIHPLNVGLVMATPMKVSRARSGPRGGGGSSGRGAVLPGGAAGPAAPAASPKTYLEDVIDWMSTWPDWPSGSEMHIDKLTSSLMVLTTPQMHERLSEMLEMMDRPPIQVLISTRFITISVDDLSDLGLDFSMNTKPGQDIGLSVGSGSDLGVTGGTGLTAMVTGSDTDPLFAMTLRALQQKGRAKILSAPQIITLNNQKGVIDISTQFNYVSDWREVSTVDVTNEGQQIERVSNYVPVLQQQRIGFLLEVTPSVGRDLRHIILELHPKISDVSGGTKQFESVQVLQLREDEPVPATPQPIFNDKELLTRMVVQDGDLVVIGGLMSQETSRTTTKVPILGDIPLLGALFRHEVDTVGKSHLVIVVKAQIIHPSGRHYVDGNGADSPAGTGGRKRAIEGPWFSYPEPGAANGLGK